MDRASISEQIDRILNSQSFAGKGQLRKLLQVLFENMDSQTSLKPDRVIKELWPEETRTKGSADVATEVNRLRRALEQYYNGEGKNDPITICLPNRSAPGPDGSQEKRWIVAMAGGGLESHGSAPSPTSTPAASASSQRDLIIKLTAAAIVLGIVGYTCVHLLAGHEQPQSGRMDGSLLTIMNTDGKPIWSKSFPQGFSADWYYEQGIAERIWFADLDGDGRTSVLFLYLPADNPLSHSSTLICYSDRGKEKWRWTPDRKLPELEGAPATYRTMALVVLKTKGEIASRIVISNLHDPWWPNQIAVLDANGKLLSEYWHSGHLEHLTLADLDGDGRQEIIATGTSNGYHQATLVVLDPDRIFGASTEVARPELQIHGMGVAQERLRLLFPRSDLNQALYQFNMAAEATVENGGIRLAVRECLHPPSCPIWYEFDKNYHLTTAYPDESFRSAHAQFYRNSKNNHPFSAEEEAAFKKIRCLVGCPSESAASRTH